MNGKGTEAQIHGFNVNKILNPYITYISDSARKASDSLVEQYLYQQYTEMLLEKNAHSKDSIIREIERDIITYLSKNIPDFDRKLKLLKENTETSVVDPMHNRPSTISTEKNVPNELMGLIGHGGLFDPPVNPIPVNDEFYWSRFDAYSTPQVSHQNLFWIL